MAELAFVIPAHNEEDLISRCLESVLAEAERARAECEVVVVNNASTDRTKEIAAGYPGVQVVDEMQKGLVHARAAGFEATTAPLVANIDADTIVPEGWVSTVLDEFRRHPEIVALSGPYIYYDLSRWDRFLVRLFYYASYLVYRLAEALKFGAMIQGGNFVLKREAWIRAGGFDRSIAFYGEDTDVAVRMSRLGRVKWTFRLPMMTTGRRLKAEGVFRTAATYVLNFFWVTFVGRPKTREYTDIRPK